MKTATLMATTLVGLVACDSWQPAQCIDGACGEGRFDSDASSNADSDAAADGWSDGVHDRLAAPSGFVGMYTSVGYQLSWSDESASEVGFRLERRSALDEEYTLLAELDADITEHVDTGRTPGTDYWYRLSAFGEVEQSDFVTLDSSLPLWTYIRIYDYDDLWGEAGTPAEELAVLEHYIAEDTAAASSSANLELLCLGDAYGDAGSYYAVGGQTTELLPQAELDMADVSTYQDFFDWVVESHPGQRYVVEYWSHGGGAAYPDGALAYDATSGGGGLSPAEMSQVLGYLARRTGRPVELLFLCTCLNGMVENAYEWRESISWLVAGETTVGCGYSPFQALMASEGLSPTELAAATVDGYRTEARGQGYNVVYSAVDAGHVAALASALDDLARALLSFIDAGAANGETLRAASGSAEAMGSGPGDFAMAYVDLYDFCLEVTSRVTEESIVAACGEVTSLLDGHVVTDFAASDPGHYDDAHGLSIFHPNPRYPYYYSPGAPEYYEGHALSIDTSWDEYLFALYPPSR